MKKKFELGKVLTTETVDMHILKDTKLLCFIFACLKRHQSGDWGDLPIEDKALNDQALENNSGRLFSAYRYTDDSEIWIITDGNGEITTILRPEDY